MDEIIAMQRATPNNRMDSGAVNRVRHAKRYAAIQNLATDE